MKKKIFVLFVMCCFITSTCTAGVACATQTATDTMTKKLADYAVGVDPEELISALGNILDELNRNAPVEDQQMKDRLQNLLGDSAADVQETELVKTLQLYLSDYVSAESTSFEEIAPGCMSHIVLAAAGIFVSNVICLGFGLEALSSGYEYCTYMYACWAVASICSGLSSWIQYRICAEEGLDSPDQDALSGLQQDWLFLTGASVVFLGIGAVFMAGCGVTPFYLFW